MSSILNSIVLQSFIMKDYKEKIQKVLSDYDFIVNTVVFGSYANSKMGEFSDIDMAIETSREVGILELGGIISNLETCTNKKIDLVLLNSLYKHRPLLAYNIYINHKIIFIKDMQRYNDFKINALHYYMDFKYILDEQNKAFRQRVANGNIGKTKTA